MGTRSTRSAEGGARSAGAILGTLLLLPAVAWASAPVFQHTPPSGSASGDIVIRASIRANGPVLEPFCFWRVAGRRTYVRVRLRAEGGARYEAVIARQAIPPRARAIEYYLEAFDSNLAEGSWRSKAAPYLLRLRRAEPRHTLAVTSVPAGALLDLDGETVGSTPFQTRLPPGQHVISLRMPGFHAYRLAIRLPPGRDVRLTIPLEADVKPLARTTGTAPGEQHNSLPPTVVPAPAPITAAMPPSSPAAPVSPTPAAPTEPPATTARMSTIEADLQSFPEARVQPAAPAAAAASPNGISAPVPAEPAIAVPLLKVAPPTVPPAAGVAPVPISLPGPSVPEVTARGPWWWIVGTAALAAAAVGTYYALDSRSARAELEGLSAPSNDVPATAARLRSSAITADALYSGAAVAAVGSAVIFVWRVP